VPKKQKVTEGWRKLPARSFMIYAIHHILFGEHFKEYEMFRACGFGGGEVERVEGFGGET